MRKIWLTAFFAASVFGVCLCGCSKKPAPRPQDVVAVPAAGTPDDTASSTNGSGGDVADAQPVLPPVAAPEPTAQEKYDAALLEALNEIADKK